MELDMSPGYMCYRYHNNKFENCFNGCLEYLLNVAVSDFSSEYTGECPYDNLVSPAILMLQ